MKTRAFLKYFVRGCLWKHFFASNSAQVPSNSISLTILVTLSSVTQFYSKIRANKLQKSAEICVT